MLCKKNYTKEHFSCVIKSMKVKSDASVLQMLPVHFMFGIFIKTNILLM